MGHLADLTYTRRLENIEKLRILIPQLRGKVYPVDYDSVSDIFTRLSRDPRYLGGIPDFLEYYIVHLHGVIRTAELYQRYPKRRELMQNVVQILEDILNG